MTPTVNHEPDQEVKQLAQLAFHDPRAGAIMEQMRKKLAEGFGVTVVGPHLTLRWSDGKHHVQASFVCVNLEHSAVLTPHDSEYNK